MSQRFKSILFRRDRALALAIVSAIIFALVAGTFMQKPIAVEAGTPSITINSTSLTLFNDADANNFANIGDTVRIEVDVSNSDGGCVAASGTVTADMTAYGGTASESAACTSDNGGTNDIFRLDFVIVDAGGSGIDVLANDASSAVTITADDADESPEPTGTSNNAGAGADSAGATNGVDTIAPSVTSWDLNMDTGVLSLTFDDTMDAGSLDVTGITIEDHASSPTTSYTLTDSSTSDGDGTTIDVDLSGTDLNAIKTDIALAIDDPTSNLVITSAVIEDAAGNSITAIASGSALNVNLYTGDSTSPTGTLSVSPALIFEGSLVSTVTITYDEPMLGSSTPTVSFTTSTSFASNSDGAWSSVTYTNDTWTESFTHDGTEEEVLPETVSSSGATDTASNPEGTSVDDTFDIDTQKPTIVSITVDDLPTHDMNISDDDVGANNFEIEIVFDENMNTGIAQVISFSPDVELAASDTLDFVPGSSNWDSSTTYTAVYTVKDANAVHPSVDVNVDSAEDEAGNVMVPDTLTGSAAFSVDTSNPAVVLVETLDGYDPGTDGDMLSTTADGFLDGLYVMFDKAVSDTSDSIDTGCGGGAPTGWSINVGTITGCETGALSDDNVIILYLDNTTWTTGGEPELTVSSAALEDHYGNPVDDISAFVSMDTAPPVITETETYDSDSNGQIDELTLRTSEPVNITDAISGDAFPDLTLDGGYSIDNGAYGIGPVTEFTIDLTESGLPDTDALVEATYTINGGTVHKIVDTTGNEMGDYDDLPQNVSVTELDGASPAPIDINYFDYDGSPSLDGSVSSVVVEFSEAITGSVYEHLDWLFVGIGSIRISEINNDGAGTVGENEQGNPNTSMLRMDVTADPDETGTPTSQPSITYSKTGGATNNSIRDAAGNPVETFGPVTIDDNAAPYPILAEYYDDGYNGTIAEDGTVDSMILYFSEDILYPTCDADEGDWLFHANTFSDFAIPVGSCTHTVIDNQVQLYIEATEDQTGKVYVMDDEPEIFATLAPGDLTDDFTDPETSSKNSITTAAVQGYMLTDMARPAIRPAIYYGSDDLETDDFNENGLIDRVNVPVTELVTNVSIDDFTAIDGTFGTYNLSSIDNNDDQLLLHIDEITTAPTGDTSSTPTITDLGTFEDLNGHPSTGDALVAMDDADPVICTSVHCTDSYAVYRDVDTPDGNVDTIVLVFSEDVIPDSGEDDLSDGILDGDEFHITNTTKSLSPSVAGVSVSGGRVELSFTPSTAFPFGEGDTGDDFEVFISDVFYDMIIDTSPQQNKAYGGVYTIPLDDDAEPARGYCYTDDYNMNGYIESVIIDFSESMNYSALSTLLDIEVDGYDMGTEKALCPGCKGAGPHAIAFEILEGDDYDTGATPDVTIVGSMEDMAGNALHPGHPTAGPEAAIDTARPIVVDSDPSDGGTLRPRDGDIEIVFSEEMDTTSLDDFGFHQDYDIDPDPGGVSESFSLNGLGHTVMTVEHDSFDNNQLATFVIDTEGTGGADLEGNGLCGGAPVTCSSVYELTFTAKNQTGGGGGGGGGPMPGTTPLVNSVSITSPADGEVFDAGSVANIAWEISGSGINTMELSYSTDGGATSHRIATNVDKESDYNWTIPITLEGNVLVTVTAQDSGKANLDSDSVEISVIGASEEAIAEAQAIAEIEAGIVIDGQGRRIAPSSGENGPSPITGDSETISSVAPGWYIRSYNLNTIYYITEDYVRRPFWDATTFMTWADSWDEIVWVTDATLPTMELGAPMLAKPGVVLVKISSIPNVYAVEYTDDPNYYQIRWITSETIASTMYGARWSDYIIDINPTIKARYIDGIDITFAEPVNTSIMETRHEIAAQVAGTPVEEPQEEPQEPPPADSDGDGLPDSEEYDVYRTDPFNPDTDGDGYSDRTEILAGYDPLIPADSDGDGLNDGEETNIYGTNPFNSDTDGDGFDDGTEVANGYDPLS